MSFRNDITKEPVKGSIVYLVQEPTVPKGPSARVIDTTPLTWWGSVRVLMERNQKASFNPGAAYLQLVQRLNDYDPDKDYIAVAGGDSLAVIQVGGILSSQGHPYFHYLRFERTKLPGGFRDPSSGAYAAVRVPLTPSAVPFTGG